MKYGEAIMQKGGLLSGVPPFCYGIIGPVMFILEKTQFFVYLWSLIENYKN